MALLRRTGQRSTANIWPGFVDAMTALLLVLMFVLTIFMIVQYILRETITTQDTQLTTLSQQVANLAKALGLEQQRSDTLETEVGRLDGELVTAQSAADVQAALIATLSQQTQNQQAQIESFEAQVASLLAEKTDLTTANETLTTRISEAEAEALREVSEKEALELALARVREEIDESAQAARLAAAKREALEALIADMQANLDSSALSLQNALAALESSQASEADQSASAAALQAQLDASMANLSEEEKARLAEAAAAEALRQRLADAENALSDEEKSRLAEAAAAEALREKLKNADAELTAMTLALEEQRKKAEDTLTLLAAAELAQRTADDELAKAVAALATLENAADATLSDAEKNAILLAQANALLDQEKARSAEGLREIALLNQQTATLRQQLNSLQALLDSANAKDAEAQVQIESLGSNLNIALAQVAAEQKARAELEEAERKRLEAEAKDLEKFKSEFFGQMRQLLGDREGVKIVGDRFVFSSEVLFPPGSTELSPEGENQIAGVASVIRDVAGEIPAEIDWILRVDGHTDNVPLSGTGKYEDNWELSQGRALAVVRYMIDFLGIPADRLAATGFGEYQPINPANSSEARAQNRRIELKFTEK